MPIKTVYFVAKPSLHKLYEEYPKIQQFVLENNIQVISTYLDGTVKNIDRSGKLLDADIQPKTPPGNNPVPVAIEVDEKDAFKLVMTFSPILQIL